MPDRDWIIIIVLGFAWGSTFFFNEMLLRDIGPVSVSLARVATAALGCWTYLLLTRRHRRISAATLAQLAAMGALMFAAPFAIYPLGQQYVASGVAAIVNALTPIMVVIVSHLWPGGERATLLKSAGVLAGFAGILLLTVPALQAGEQTRLFGTLVLLFAPLSYAVALNFVRRFHAIDPAVMVTWAFTFATALLIPLAFGVEGAPGPIRSTTWLSIAILGFVLTGATFMVAFHILPRAGATKTSTVTFVAPVSALLIGRFALNEELAALHFAGMAAIFLGLLLIDGRLFRRADPKLNRSVE